jgi:hypothetical protein
MERWLRDCSCVQAMPKSEPSTTRTCAAVMKSLALLVLLLGASCGGQVLSTNAAPDAASAQEAGQGQDASSGQHSDGDDSVDAGPPDSTVRVPDDHRPDDSQCATARAQDSCPVVDRSVFGGCSLDSDCAEGGVGGRCTLNDVGPGGCSCTYDSCQTDTDCGDGNLCACHGSPYSIAGNSCVPGNCRVDSDCGAGGYCSPAQATVGCGFIAGYYCHSPKDTCTNDSDCGGFPGICTWSTPEARWDCQTAATCP